MIEEYGFLYYRAPSAGVALPIADGREAWLMEIFGPGDLRHSRASASFLRH